MRGSIDKRSDKVYRIRLHLGYDGAKRVTHTETVHGTKKEAEARMRDLIAEFERGNLTGRSRKSLNEFLQDWLETIKTAVKGRTHRDYTELVARYVNDPLPPPDKPRAGRKTARKALETRIGRFPLDKLTSLTIQKLYNEMTELKLSGRTVRRLHTVLNQALRQAVDWRMLAHNPAAAVQLPRMKTKKIRKPFNEEQARAFLAGTREHRLGCAFRFGMEAGCRPQEYAALEWPDINFETGVVTISKVITWPKGGGFLVETPKSEAGYRSIQLSPVALEDLRQQRGRVEQLRQEAGTRWTGTMDLVFPNSFGNPLSLYGLNVGFKEVMEKAALAGPFSPYSLRHTNATLMLGGAVPAKVAAERLGHSTIVLTLNTYSHVLAPMQQQASSALEGILHGSGHALDTKDTKQDGSGEPKDNSESLKSLTRPN